MKPWLILIGLSVAITAATTVILPFVTVSSTDRGPTHPAPAAPEGPAPAVVIEGDQTHEFGALPQQYKGKHSWVIRNDGPGTLELRGISSTCSCTNAELFEQTGGQKTGKTAKLEPGKTMTIPVTFDTKGFDGHYRQTVTIGTNDPMKPEIALAVEGTVRPAIITEPPSRVIPFLTVSNEEPTMRLFYLYSSDRPDLKITRLANPNPDFIGLESRPITPDEAKRLKAEKGYAIEVTVKPSPNLGEFAQEIVIETDHPMMPEVRFKILGKVTGPLTAVPERVTIRGATASNGGSDVLTLLARGRTSVNFIVEKKPPGMDVTIKPLPVAAGSKGSKYEMTVSLSPGIEPGLITDEIVLKTDDPKVNEFRVPVNVLVLGAR